MVRVLLFIALAGALGGCLNAGLSPDGFAFPRIVDVPGGKAFLPGFFGNIFAGAGAAFLSFALYGPFASLPIFGTGKPALPPLQLTLAAIAGAMLVGYSGGRWLTAESARQLNQAALQVTVDKTEQALTRMRPQGSAAPQKQLISDIRAIKTSSPFHAYETALAIRDTGAGLAE
jgi:hypothetical protein